MRLARLTSLFLAGRRSVVAEASWRSRTCRRRGVQTCSCRVVHGWCVHVLASRRKLLNFG